MMEASVAKFGHMQARKANKRENQSKDERLKCEGTRGDRRNTHRQTSEKSLHLVCFVKKDKTEQNKGAWGMPWLSEARKDVTSCEKPWRGANAR